MSINIYIACLSSYNAGFLHGKHFDLDDYTDKEELLKDIEEQVLRSPDNPMVTKYSEEPEEWAMHDIEGIDYSHIGTESPDLQTLIDMNVMLNEEGEDTFEAIIGLKSHLGCKSLDDAKRYHDEHFVGEFADHEKLADHMLESEGHDLTQFPFTYFDYESYGRDLAMDMIEIGNFYYWNR